MPHSSQPAPRAGTGPSMFQRLQQLYLDLGGPQGRPAAPARPADELPLSAAPAPPQPVPPPFAAPEMPSAADDAGADDDLVDPDDRADSEDEDDVEGSGDEGEDDGTDPALAPGGKVMLRIGPAPELVEQCQQHLTRLGIRPAAGSTLTVTWNSRLRSTAGYAGYPSWRIELNPRLQLYPGETERTLLHELAHLVAYHRASRRRIEPHGPEWRQACADLGIPNESARHRLPLPRTQQERRHIYQCRHCQTLVRRVRPFRNAVACLTCCRQHNGGRYSAAFQLVKVKA